MDDIERRAWQIVDELQANPTLAAVVARLRSALEGGDATPIPPPEGGMSVWALMMN